MTKKIVYVVISLIVIILAEIWHPTNSFIPIATVGLVSAVISFVLFIIGFLCNNESIKFIGSIIITIFPTCVIIIAVSYWRWIDKFIKMDFSHKIMYIILFMGFVGFSIFITKNEEV